MKKSFLALIAFLVMMPCLAKAQPRPAGASISRTAQGASISATSILTPSANGLFEVAVVQMVMRAGAAGTVKTEIHWTDEQGAHTRVLAPDLDLSDASEQENGIAVIRATTSAPITFETTVTGSLGAPQYDLFINVRTL